MILEPWNTDTHPVCFITGDTGDGRPQHGRIRIIPNGRFQGHNAQLFNTDGGTYCPNTWRNGSECVPVSGKDSRP